MSTLGIAALQLAGAAEGNLELFERETRAVVRRLPWVEMVVAPELFIHGVKKSHAEAPGGPTEQHLQALAKDLGVWLIPGSLYQERNGKVFNTTPVINPEGAIIDRYSKMCPFRPYEAGVESGENYVIFDVPGAGRIGIAICYDIWFPEIIRTMAAMGAEAIIAPTLTNTADRDVEVSIARANAAVNQCYFLAVNGVGELGNGRSVFYAPGGDFIYECGMGRDIVALELDFAQVRRQRERGWHGLGQVLKSFRDAPAAFPMHVSPEARKNAMAGLGPLETPQRSEKNAPEFNPDSQGENLVRLNVIDRNKQ